MSDKKRDLARMADHLRELGDSGAALILERMGETDRRVRQIAVAEATYGRSVIALCEDGTLWEYRGGAWHPLPPIPEDRPHE